MLTIHTPLRMDASAACQRKHPIAGKPAVTGTCRELPICTLCRQLSRDAPYAGGVTASEPAAGALNAPQKISAPGKHVRTAAFFDLDKTVIAKSSTLAFSKPFFDQGLINRRAVAASSKTATAPVHALRPDGSDAWTTGSPTAAATRSTSSRSAGPPTSAKIPVVVVMPPGCGR